MHIQPFQAVHPNTDFITSADHFFSTVKEEFNDYVLNGFFKATKQEGIYIHRIAMPHRSFTGLLACLDIEDYLDGCIKKHENTLPALEQAQMHLLLHRRAQVKPVMLTYHPVAQVEAAVESCARQHPPFLEINFEESGQRHSFWEIGDPQLVGQLQALFQEKVPVTYIADGHHRISTLALMFQRQAKKKAEGNPYRHLLCALYPTSELEIHDFNRIVEGLNDLTPTVFMAKLSQLFEIQVLDEARKPAGKHELTMYLDREWFRLRWRAEVLEEFSHHPVLLDVTLLNEKVLKGVLGVRDVRTDARVKYLEGPKGLEMLKDKTLRSDERLAFCLHPVSMDDFLKISDAGGVLPPKSTWFEPRIRSGLMVRQF